MFSYSSIKKEEQLQFFTDQVWTRLNCLPKPIPPPFLLWVLGLITLTQLYTTLTWKKKLRHFIWPVSILKSGIPI
jgi:hypothetical protein